MHYNSSSEDRNMSSLFEGTSILQKICKRICYSLMPVFISVLYSCNLDKSVHFPESIKNLEEIWKLTTENEFEIWSYCDSVYCGKVIHVSENDTVIREKLRLIIRNENIFYEANVNGQNNGLPVLFKLTEKDEKILRFENPDHDFPKHIEYKFHSPKKLTANVALNPPKGG